MAMRGGGTVAGFRQGKGWNEEGGGCLDLFVRCG